MSAGHKVVWDEDGYDGSLIVRLLFDGDVGDFFGVDIEF